MIRLGKEAAIVTVINVINFKINGMDTMDSMNSKVIVLWGDDTVLLKSVELLLNTRETWQVVRLSDEWDDGTLIQEVKTIYPDVFILHEGTFLKKLHLVTKFVQDFPRLKVVTIKLDNNQLEIYSKKTICIRESSELLSIIADDIEPEGGEVSS